MSFSMPSYFLGVGTVVGALALGFGGGIVLTKTAIKDTPAGPSRLERVARSEPAASQAQVTEAKVVPVTRVDQSPAQRAPEVVPPVQAAADDPKPVAETATPARLAETVKPVDAPKQIEQSVRQVDMKPVEQPVRQGEAKLSEPRDSNIRAERAQRRAEQRRIERDKRIAERERKARTVIVVRPQRPLEEQEQSARPQLAFQREESGPNLFEGLFGRPAEAASGERD